MNNRVMRVRKHIDRQKKRYLVLIGIMLIGIILGFLFYFIISDNDKKLVVKNTLDFFSGIRSGKIDYLRSMFNSLTINSLYIIGLFLLGISIVGFIFIIGIILIKSIVIGFSIASIIATFKLKGILVMFLYIFPHQVIYMTLIILMSFYGCSFCSKLYKHLFSNKIVNFKEVTKRYVKIMILCLIVSVFCSIYEVFIATYLINLII